MKHRLALLFPALLATGSVSVLVAQAAQIVSIIQKGRAFSVAEVTIDKGDTLRFSNADDFLHQLFVHSQAMTVDSDEQRPGQDVDIAFPVSGQYRVLCTIHPKMSLTVDVR